MSKGVDFRKKFLVVVLSALLVVNLSGCGEMDSLDSSETKKELSLKEKIMNKANDVKNKVSDTIDEINEDMESRAEERKLEEENETEEITTEKETVKQVKVKDLTSYSKKKAEKWCKKHNLEFEYDEDYSDKVKEGKCISQSIEAGESVDEGTEIELIYSLGKKPSKEELNALKSAETYSDYMHMSKKGIYDQLVSEYGDGFTPEAAKYAVDHLKADYKKNALESAKTYQDMMAMSKNAIYDQLVSEYGEQFTAAEAQYAIDHLDD